MAEMKSLVEQTIADFDDIELAMEELGVDVPYGTDTSQYGNLIRANFAVDQEYKPESEKAQSGKAVAEALASLPIKYLESLDSENYRNLYDLESGMYVLYGTFFVYPNATKKYVFSKKLFVAVSHGTKSTCVQVLYPAYNTLQYLNIYPDEASETGYSYERKDAQLYYMEDTRNKVTALDGTVTDEQYPSAKAVYNALPTELSQLADDATHRTVTDIEKAEWNAKSEFSGAYADLTGVPTKVSDFENDSGYAKTTEVSAEKTRAEGAESALGTRITEETNRATAAEEKISTNFATHKAAYETKLVELTNADSANATAIANEEARAKAAEKANVDAITEIKNAGYVTDTELENKGYAKATEIPTELSELNEDATHRTVTDTEKATWNAKSDFSGAYADLTGVPTKVSAFDNDSGYLTESDIVNPDYNETNTTSKAYILNRPCYSEVIGEVNITTENGSGSILINSPNLTYAWHVSNDTFTKEQLIGATVGYYDDYYGSLTYFIKGSSIQEETSDGLDIFVPSSMARIFVAYTAGYKPSMSESALPSVGIYFSYGQAYDNPRITSLSFTEKNIKKLDNELLDLENNEVIKALLARIEALEASI